MLAAPIWANNVAHTGPNESHTLQKLRVGDEVREVVTPEGRPIGPQWFEADGKFFLGADSRLGRDEMVRLMYGGRTSLFIGVVSGLITTFARRRPRPARRLLQGLGRRGDRPHPRYLWSLPCCCSGSR